ncbi:clathrin interactor EPSIN 2-like protein [Cinnamomum micranthum f. kanehirae]|uniref:Clathrin interactor EPSIN 2-like protein n=1 Tax=Cinnamomum micranthum f. kanehirae TaxID=337451 RepID=A0A443Q0T9_9MAGN|nr:clathrin interactor EPSIN 2-like protein [Cinnamomum micranthum f. kanehirae]
MKKAFGQTVRDLKREVNKTVLKVPKIEQKVLDATSNEPWGPHGSHLAEIAQATRNYNEFQIIMAVLWKRINSTGKKWRHVYKALTVLEYLVVHGSERIIYEIREHAYQLSTLYDFQYIDSSGRDQGSNVRRKSQGLIALVNDKERMREVRLKAEANEDRYQSASATGGMYRPSDRNGDCYEGRNGNRKDDRNGYGRDQEWGHRDDEKYGRGRDLYGQGGDCYDRGSNDRYSKYRKRNDDCKESGSNGDYHSASRNRSSVGDKHRPYEDDDQCSSRQLERNHFEQTIGPPPSYDAAVSDSQSHFKEESERDGGLVAAALSPRASSPSGNTSEGQATTMADIASSASNREVDEFDEFDPRASRSASLSTVSAAEMDLLGAFSDSFPQNSLALVPVVPASEPVQPANYDFGCTPLALSLGSIIPSENPFEDSPFVAVPFQDNFTALPHNFAPTTSLQPPPNVGSEPLQLVIAKEETVPAFDFGETFQVLSYSPGASSVQSLQLPPTTPVRPPFSAAPCGDNLTTKLQNFALSTSSQPPMTVGSEPHQLATVKVEMFPPYDFGATFQGLNYASGVTDMQFPPTTRMRPPFSAAPEDNCTAHPQNFAPLTSLQPPTTVASEPHQLAIVKVETVPAFDYGDTFDGSTYAPAITNVKLPPTTPKHPPLNSVPSGENFTAQPQNYSPTTSLQPPAMSVGTKPHQPATARVETAPAFDFGDTFQCITYVSPTVNNVLLPSTKSEFLRLDLPHAQQPSSDTLGNILPQSGPATPTASQGALVPIPTVKHQPPKDKFEPKSTVWADTLSRGLVNLNISGPKANPLADIGIDFVDMNRKEKRKEKSTAAPVISTVIMGKAMGAGSGIGRAGASGLVPPPNAMLGSGMGMRGGAGMGMGGGASMGMGGSPGMAIGMADGIVMGMGMGNVSGMGMGGYGAGLNQSMGMNMGMGMGQGAAQMFPGSGLPPGMQGGYNTMGMGGYTSQQPYGGPR